MPYAKMPSFVYARRACREKRAVLRPVCVCVCVCVERYPFLALLDYFFLRVFFFGRLIFLVVLQITGRTEFFRLFFCDVPNRKYGKYNRVISVDSREEFFCWVQAIDWGGKFHGNFSTTSDDGLLPCTPRCTVL